MEEIVDHVAELLASPQTLRRDARQEHSSPRRFADPAVARHRDHMGGEPCAIAVQDRAAFETESHVRRGSLECGTRSDERARTGLGFSERHDADAARHFDGFELAFRRKPSERPADRLDLRRVRRSDGGRSERERHAVILRV